MPVRKNAKYMSPDEREAFVKACVLMKADIVNPGAAAADQYSHWDELAAVHRMIQNANAPGTSTSVNFGHGGSGSYSFLSWHRYFLFLFEQRLQSYVPGVMLPYWDWADPAPILTDTFLGPNGTAGTNEVDRGYFAADAPGTGTNPTPAPIWWPAGLAGWRLHPAFGATYGGALRRNINAASSLPTVNHLRGALAKSTYPEFQNALESGAGLPPGSSMHNGLHTWWGGASHMYSPQVSPFDPVFYMHHCNVDRLWAMWQADGHATEYPSSGGDPQHHRNDLMYPWVGATPGYSTNVTMSPIVMPDFSALGEKRNGDMLDYRALGYTYDTLAVVGIGLDRTGSMLGVTPDPMTVGAPDITKWQAATRGVSAFLQDCETVYQSAVTYVLAGVKTFRSIGLGNQFDSVFPSPGSGLVKNGGSHSRATFDSAVAGMSPGGGTPLADALQDVHDTLVTPPFGGRPAGELRFLAMLTDGMLTAGSPLSSIPDGSFVDTAVFAMGFGTGGDVDYPTLDAMTAKGRDLGVQQVFHGENAGTIDKFYSNTLARAIGFSTVIDPVVELFAGEHVHLQFEVTSAEDAVFVTAQGMDFSDKSWAYHLVGPDGAAVYADGVGRDGHGHGGVSHGRPVDVTGRRAAGRVSLVLQRDSAPASAWVGTWQLMAAFRATELDAMVMPFVGELIFPVSAGPVRGSRYSRLLQRPRARPAARSVRDEPRNRLDVRPPSTNNDDGAACSLVVNVYARTRLRLELVPRKGERVTGGRVTLDLAADVLAGDASLGTSFGRLVSPVADMRGEVERVRRSDIPEGERLPDSAAKVDSARVLARLERENPELGRQRDEEVEVVTHEGSAAHVHVGDTGTPGVYHLGIYVEGSYCPDHDADPGGGHDHDGEHGPGTPHVHGPDCRLEHFSRILTTTVALELPERARPA
jgi:hypothetical protein